MNKRKLWSKKEKIRVVRKVLSTNKSLSTIAKEESLDVKIIIRWVRKYNNEGENGLSSNRNKTLAKRTTQEKTLGWELENILSKKVYWLKEGVQI